jgi:hypothetical protein
VRPIAVGALGLTLALLPAVARSQISPGRLSRAHASLEGSGKCLECHEAGKGVAADKCLACHKALKQRVAAGQGLHARPEYRDCKTCHVEHQGLEYELVWWGKQGKQGFDHALSGQPLVGKHARIACQECHKTRSYLGAATTCASCHKDEHRGQFGGRACSDCHRQEAWSPAPGFDHARTEWPLTGRHAAIGCEKCHVARRRDPANPALTYRVFRAVAGRDCASCHEDTHRGRLGHDCTSCHSTASWRGSVKTAQFDHAKTAYPLTGRHATVACERCHVPGRPLRLKHDRCTDCHADAHGGDLARRADGGRCESCHDVSGFRPARFGVEDHAKTAYPLTGSHLAVACDQCHRPVPAGRPGAALPFHFRSTRCLDCHKDPHRGELSRIVAKGGCEACHRVESWRQVAFDHGQTKYPLAGSHLRVSCTGCHGTGAAAQANAVGGPSRLRFVGVPVACAGCHRDPHEGQFAGAADASSCERCHTTDTVKASRFDHDRDATYRLDGAHARLACAACHRTETRGATKFVRYKPLPTTCGGCHRGGSVPINGGHP